MPAIYRRPGVYLEESLMVNQAFTSASFTVAAFIGVAEKGPVNTAARVDSWSDYVSTFGGFSPIQPPLGADPNDITVSIFGADPVPANLTALKADAEYGDAGTAEPTTDFDPGRYVVLGDDSQAHWASAGGGAWAAGPMAGQGAQIPGSAKALSYLPFAVYSFFQSGGRTAYIIRSVSSTTGQEGAPAGVTVNGADTEASLLRSFQISALSVGTWGNTIKYNLATQETVGAGATAEDVFTLQVYVTNADGADELVETFPGLSVAGTLSGTRRVDMAINDPTAGSQYITVTGVNEDQPRPAATTSAAVPLTGGADPGLPDSAALVSSADQVGTIDGPVMINVVGYHNDISKINTTESASAWVSGVVSAASFTERQDIFVVNDSAAPRQPNQTSASYKTSLLTSLGTNTGDSYMGAYAPWILIPHPQKLGETIAVPPGGGVVGVMSRIDSTVGMYRAPAGVIAGITNAVGVQTKFTDTELGDLNSANINAIRSVPGAGICVMGARTRKSYGPDHYVSARRTLIYIKEALRLNTQFAVFENNDESLWAALRMSADRILRPLWTAGGLKGVNASEAYFITCDDTLNTPAVIQSGEVRMEVGVALQYPAEFVIVRITQFERATFAAEVYPTS